MWENLVLGVEDVVLMVGFNNPGEVSKVRNTLLLIVILVPNIDPLFQHGWW